VRNIVERIEPGRLAEKEVARPAAAVNRESAGDNGN
jgi:hypothetical protein